MNRTFHISRLFLIAFCLCMLAISAFSQTTLTRRCPGVAPATGYSRIELLSSGDINFVPCSTKNILLRGSIFSGGGGGGDFTFSLNGLTAATQTFATGAADTAAIVSTGTAHTFNNPITAVSGASRTGYFPFFDTSNTLAKSPFQFNGTDFLFNNATNNATFKMKLTPATNAGSGYFEVGNLTTALQVLQASNQVAVSAGTIQIAAGSVGSGLNLISGKGVSIFSEEGATITGAGASINNLTVTNSLNLERTITAAGTTGNRTINKLAGTVNVPAGQNVVVVTNGFVTVNSILSVVARTNDATCGVKNYVPGAGNFTINLTASCTAETSIGFIVSN